MRVRTAKMGDGRRGGGSWEMKGWKLGDGGGNWETVGWEKKKV